MFAVYRRGVALGLAVATGVLGCSGPDHPRPDPSSAGSGAAASAAGAANAGSGAGVTVMGGGASNKGGTGSGNAGSGPGASGGANGTGSSNGNAGSAPTGLLPAELIPQRIRRLTNAEFDASVSALTGSGKALGEQFAPDARQAGFTVNDAQRIDNVTAKQIFAAAQELAAELKLSVTTHAPCATAAGSDACAKTFISAFGQRAYRRPLTAEEADALFTVYQTGQSGGTYADGIELVATAVLNSAGFLYLTELGSGPPAAATETVALTPYELANALSYLATAAPADDALVADALAGKLDTAGGRASAFLTLIGGSSRDRIGRIVGVVREWVGVDRLRQTDKDSTVYPAFKDLKASMEAETVDFISTQLQAPTASGPRSVELLLSAESTVVSGPLATFYKTSSGAVQQSKRKGILNQAAFLSVFAHASESAPVLRGVEIARRIACLSVPSPTTLNIQVVPPQPDTTKTTRERFATHVSDPECASCHKSIDGFGFAFEEYDGMGQFRTTEGKNPIDSKVTVAVGGDTFDGVYDEPYDNGNRLAIALSKSAQVRACFARHMFRASAARSDDTIVASEAAFLKSWQALEPNAQGDILETLLTYVKSPLFTHRRGS